jgi:hypothetical protein
VNGQVATPQPVAVRGEMRAQTCGCANFVRLVGSNRDPLDLIEAHLFAPAVVELLVRVEAWFAMNDG